MSGRGKRCQHKTKILCFSLLYRSLDPPKSPLRRGTLSGSSSCIVNRDFENLLSPPLPRGAAGDRRARGDRIYAAAVSTETGISVKSKR